MADIRKEMVNLSSGGVGFEARWEGLFSKGDEFNLVWVPPLRDIGPPDVNFQIFKRRKNYWQNAKYHEVHCNKKCLGFRVLLKFHIYT